MPPKKATSAGSKPNSKKQKLNDSSSLDTGGGTDRIMSKEEEEEMSSALIAQLLAQEGGGDGNGYYAEYNNDIHYEGFGGGVEFSDDDDDYRQDYSYRPKSKSRRAASKKKAKPAPAPVAKPAPKSTPKPASKPTLASTTATTTPTVTTETTINTASNGIETVAVVSSGEGIVPSTNTNVDELTSSVTTTPTADVASAPIATAPTASTPTAATSTISASEVLVSEASASEVSAPEVPAPVASTPKPKPVKEIPVYNTGVYSEREEKAFVDALNIFGRNWRSVEQHVATRDANSIRSHAQKHFIKLFRDNIPLPPKVLESGPGYTLSGNDLNPYSSAARPYLTQRMLDDPSLLPAQGGTIFTPDSTAAIKAEKAQAKEKKAIEAAESREAKETLKETVKEMKELKIRKAPKVHKETSRPRADVSSDEPVYTGRTDYSKARLRSARDRSSIHYRQMASDLDPLTMVKCEPFCGQPNSGVVGCQPFGIKVKSNVLLGMDFHAHLMTAEIIGFLAGDWDSSTRTIHVKAIFPCRSLPTEHNHVNVEMDPTSEFEVRQEIEKRNMRIVGWYHSHPTFTPDPSLVDIENQRSYQSLFKDDTMNEEPFVGAIVGPYDERLPGLSSVINWFYISRSPQERGHPKRLVYDLIEDECLPEEESSLWIKLFDEYRDSPERTNFKERWRQEENETKLQKMLVSLGRRMPWLRNNLLKSQEQDEVTNAENVQDGAGIPEKLVVTESAPNEVSVEMPVEVNDIIVAVASEAESAAKDPEILPAIVMEANKEDEHTEPLSAAPIEAECLIAPTLDINGEPESMEGIESTASHEVHTHIEEEGEQKQIESKDVAFEPLVKSGSEDSDESQKDISVDESESDNLQGLGMERSLSNASSASSISSSLSSSSGVSSSHHSQGSSKAWAAATFGGLINDPFLALVEQELSGWEYVV
ncbi:hypothetical protein FBU30_000687 [Linnemannia zychae]|nr:hypothetical protein FBU30_000687 [Linnemannia zychae]